MSYLEFISSVDEIRKMQKIEVASQKKGDLLGVIEYYPQWRQYVFAPIANTVWSVDCLDEVKAEIVEQNNKLRRQNERARG